MANGILKKCTDCRKEKNCCCDFHKIDFPILNEREKTFIIEKYKVKDEFFVAIKDNCFNMIANQGVCPFYKDKCSIYENRPNDCKLFPYDIKK